MPKILRDNNGKRIITKDIPEYAIWNSMISRCTNPKHKSFKDYGERGIDVCIRWKNSFVAFLEDMGRRPGDGYTIERIDNERGYESNNCEWRTWKENQRNRRNNRMLNFNGRALPLSQWSEEIGILPSTIRSRLHYGWSVERALTQPIRGQAK